MGTSVCRYDFAPITGSETTEEGYLRVWARAARTGTQLYRRADGTQVREYRPPEEVSNPDALTTFGMKPATWNHPPILLDSANTQQYQIGYSGSQVKYNNGFVEVAVVITDATSIEKIKRKEATEVSAGYKVDFDPTPGITPEGESYDGVQRNIRVNHIAIVPRGRAGPEVRLLLDRMDSADAVSWDESEAVLQPHSTASPVMATVKLDGLEIDLPAEAATAVQSFARDMGRQLSAAEAQNVTLKTRVDALEEQIESLASEKEAAEGRADAYEQRFTELGENSTSRLDQAEIDQLVAARLNTLQTLAPAFEDTFKFDGISDEELYAQAFENLTGNAAGPDAHPAYTQGVVEGILAARSDSPEDDEPEAPAARQDSTGLLRNALAGVGGAKPPASVSQRTKLQEGWKKPLTATK